jgi:hypothetical protein
MTNRKEERKIVERKAWLVGSGHEVMASSNSLLAYVYESLNR